MKTSQIHIDEILTAFFTLQGAGQTPAARRRTLLVEARLRDCLEIEGERVLVTRDLMILAAEREFEPVGAVARTMHADDLIFVLPSFLEAPWLHGTALMKRAQLTLVEHLTAQLLNDGTVTYDEVTCPLHEIRARLDAARAALRTERGDKRRSV
ncbi:hypothetical protein JF66_12275 [Cryobacterium sp. MLB-32]|uniref:hypothetical protein n=1 Tax=Cryobacterium sp. MLB-32 TaxID=1529318 RepID=UPI0004E65544|nr:hypothetical protein [Cryobacterium sp. MLB-32]KFF59304.1 hypothetical protein JF66_12275 [Cryobacterium sp. MLB-32]